jgi:cardiolipin synthase (CMP-forming)
VEGTDPATRPAPDPERGVHRASVDRILTVPNVLSTVRILLIPVFVVLLLRHHTEAAGLLLLAGVVATDWVDGYVARHTGQVSNLGKLLDPVADRLAIGAALVTLVVRHAVPLWAALLVLVRDGAILVVGLALLAGTGLRIDVRWVGKLATFWLMCGFPLVAWGNFGLALHDVALPAGWTLFGLGIAAYYAAAVAYAFDLRRAFAAGRARRGTPTGAPDSTSAPGRDSASARTPDGDVDPA